MAPSAAWTAWTRSSLPSTEIVARSSPSRTSRVASPACRPDRRSEYGPAGESLAWTGSCRIQSILLAGPDGVNEFRQCTHNSRAKRVYSLADATPGRVAGVHAEPRAEAAALSRVVRARAGDDGDRRRCDGRAVRWRLVRQLLRGLVSVAAADHRRGRHRARSLPRRVPFRPGRLRGRTRASLRRRRVRSRLLERRGRARWRWARRPTAVR